MTDKIVIQQVLGSIMKRPQFLSEVDKYSLDISDFSTRFEKVIFLSIRRLYERGATKITPLDIENCLEPDTTAKSLFDKYNGIEYLNDIEDFVNIENFPYYYSKLKKLNLLRDLKKHGFDTKDFYIEDLTDPKADEINGAFDELTTKDICDKVKGKLLSLEATYATSEEVKTQTAASGIRDLVQKLRAKDNFGVPIQGKIYNQIINGAQKGALTIRSGGSGVSKTRQAVGDACLLAYPIRYNSDKREWEAIGNNEKVLFIITEQTFEQIQSMILAYLTDINESRFKFEKFTEEEEKVIEQALNVIDTFKDNFIIVKMPNPTIELIKTMVRENCLTREIDHVFYDYIFIGPALLNEFRGFSLRNDELLLMLTTALKDLAVELNVSMFTSTQVNAAADDNRNIRNEASLAGGRSTINKADNGAIMARPKPEELETLAPLVNKYGKPNIVTDIFKVRSGEWSQVRIWSIVDLGRMRKVDLFLTDANLEPVEGFKLRNYDIKDWTDEETQFISDKLKELNDGN